MKLSDARALVTGASGGIGAAIVREIVGSGGQVLVTGRDVQALQRLALSLDPGGSRVAIHVADIARADERNGLIEAAADWCGGINVLVNNAGVALLKPFEELTVEDWDTTMATNLRSLYLVTREVLPAMRARKQGAIVNIASLAGRNGFVGGSAYTASKHAVLGFAKSLMLEVRKDNVRVITICPGSVDTSLIRTQGMLSPNIDRILQPEDIADTVLAALALPERALISELDVRPTNP